MTSFGWIALAMVPRALRERFGDSPTYSQIYRKVLDGQVRARQDGGRWFVEPADLDAIGATFGLIEASQQRTASPVSGTRA
jgi:hypothetical protein